MRRWTDSLTKCAIMFVAAASLQAGCAQTAKCAAAQRFPYATPHAATQFHQYASTLTQQQQKVIEAVLNGNAALGYPGGVGSEDRTLYFALPGGVLTMWFGASNELDLHCGAETNCDAHPVVGAPNIYYYSNPGGGQAGTPREGLRWFQSLVEGLPPIDRVAIKAYAQYHVPSPWARGLDYFEGPC